MSRGCRPLNPMDGCPVDRRRALISGIARVMVGALVFSALRGAGSLRAQDAARPVASSGEYRSVTLTPTSPVDSFATATARGRFWFTARVIRRDTVTTRLIGRTRYTTAVEVDSVVAAPSGMRRFAGRTITAIVGDTTGVMPGARFFFIAAGVAVDTNLVLRERGRVSLDAATDLATITARLYEADTLNLQRALRRRADSSAMVAVARVTAITAPQTSGGRGQGAAGALRSENNPRWRRAVVSVLTSYAGEAGPAPTSYSVYFPGSRSWAYASAPRLAQDSVVVMLGRRLASLPEALRQGLDTTRAYVVWDSLDVRPVRDSSLVRKAVRDSSVVRKALR